MSPSLTLPPSLSLSHSSSPLPPAFLTVLLQLSLYPVIVETCGVLRAYRIGCNLFALVVFLIPLISYLKSHTLSQESLWVMVVTSLTLIGTAMMFTLISVFILINNSCYSHERNTVNAIGQIFVSFGRLCGPFFVAYAISMTSENGRTDWPYEYFILGAMSLLNSRLALLLPRSIERRKREPREPRYAFEDTDGETDGDNDDIFDEMEVLITEEESSFEDSGSYSSQPSGSQPQSRSQSQSHSHSKSLSYPDDLQNDVSKGKIHGTTVTMDGLTSVSGDEEYESDSLGNVTSRSL